MNFLYIGQLIPSFFKIQWAVWGYYTVTIIKSLMFKISTAYSATNFVLCTML